MPNEMKISVKGNVYKYAATASELLEDGFEHVKLVGRGSAAPMTEQISNLVRKRVPYCFMKTTMNSALNKSG